MKQNAEKTPKYEFTQFEITSTLITDGSTVLYQADPPSKPPEEGICLFHYVSGRKSLDF